jgi:hypothetical protein
MFLSGVTYMSRIGQHLLDLHERGLHEFPVECIGDYNMTGKIEIETDIPMPEGRGMSLPLAEMGVGHCFFVATPEENGKKAMLARIRTRAHRFAAANPAFKFSIIQVVDDTRGEGIRVFRVSKPRKRGSK